MKISWFLTTTLLLMGAARAADQPDKYAALYQKSCSACHGEQGTGKSRAAHALNPPPRNFTTALAREELSRERMIASVTDGRPGTAMVGWGTRLSAADIAGIVDYVRGHLMVAQHHTAREPQAPADGPGATSRRKLSPNASPGERIFVANCAVCHGDKGAGAMWTQTALNPPPRNFRAQAARDELSRERMIASVTSGRPGTAMMPFSTRLSAAQIEQVVDYIRATFMTGAPLEETPAPSAMPQGHPALPSGMTGSPRSDATPAPTTPPKIKDADMSAPFPGGLAGDPSKGRTFYMAGNCVACHGPLGDGQGPRATFITPKPRNFLAAESRRILNRPALFHAIKIGKVGTPMPAWGQVLSDQEIANVAEFVFQNFIRDGGTQSGESEQGLARLSLEKKSRLNPG